ncbi:MAG TPA: HYR domain-containing protein, partial [Prolixibacteraceae bacterium]|nr:HYR domain-containing protein [Prolixibacteraceae bacterium]
APTISCPGNILDNTDEDVCTALVSGIATPTYSDPDDNIVSVTWTMTGATTDVSPQTGINILTSHTFNLGTTTVTYRVTDAGGLSEECSFTVTVIDNQNPTIECPSSVTVSADANSCTASGVTLGTPTFSDNCTLPSNALTNDAPSVFPLGTTVVIWTVTDGAGLTSTCSQLVTVLDNQNPQLVDVPSGGDLGCNPGLADLPACDPGVTATDNCGTATVQCTPGDVIEDGCDRSQTFTYSAKDAFGNEASATVTYTWKVDNTPPVISNLPAGGDLGCNPGLADLPACSLNVMATDNCDGAVNVTCTAGAVTDVGTCGKSQVFSYYAVDACGNGATETVTYTWTIDTTPPDLTVSDNVDLGCNPTTDAIDAAKAAITASAEDNCGGPVTITYNDISGTNGCEIAFGRIFTAFDGCGNAVSKTVSIGWKTDTTAPVFTGCPTAVIDLGRNPADLPDCGDALALVSVSDHCSGAVTPSCQAGSIEQSGLQFTQTFTLRATDACNNVATCTVTYTWNIQECMPYFSDCPEEPIDLGCNPELPDCDDAKAVAGTVYDGCGGTLTPSCARGTIEENGCLRTQDFVLTAVTDDGTAICTVTYTWIESLDKPVIATTAVSGDKGCNPTIVTPEFTLVQACTPGSIVVTTNGVQGTGCAKSQTWKANFTDACLKKADEVVITYTWTEDLVKPVIATTAVSGDKGCNPTIVAPVFTLSEACSPGEIVVTTDGVQGTGCAKSQTWKANFTDACQNKADEVVVTWTWTEDLVKPVIVTTAESGDKGCNPTIVAPVFTLTEACSPGSIVVTTGGVQGTGCAKSQTWKANFTDACLNKADEVVVTYTWTEDVTAPVITCPDDKTLIVSASGTSADWTAETPTASDNCTASSTLTVTGVRSDGKALTDPWPLGTTTITWTAADECENISAPCEQTVTVIIGCLTIDAKVYLEGALINPVTSAEYTVPMRTTLNDLQMLPGQAYQDGATIFYTPAGQPYNTEPWNYDGAEGSLFDTGGSVGDAGYPATAVDWVLVSLRNTAGAGYQKICEKAALLLSDGTIEMLEGFDCCDLDMNGNYYLVVEHRNHLLVMSHVPVQVVAGTLTYDFTAQQSYILPGSGLWGQKEVDGIFFMFGGNGNQSANADSDTDINADDQSTWESHNGRQGYRSGDYNLNGDTNSNDRIIWERNNGHGTSVIRNY